MPNQTAKLFTNGRSQAVRLPREFRFQGNEVYIRREGEEVVLSSRPKSWDAFFATAETTSDDFLEALKTNGHRNGSRSDVDVGYQHLGIVQIRVTPGRAGLRPRRLGLRRWRGRNPALPVTLNRRFLNHARLSDVLYQNRHAHHRQGYSGLAAVWNGRRQQQ